MMTIQQGLTWATISRTGLEGLNSYQTKLHSFAADSDALDYDGHAADDAGGQEPSPHHTFTDDGWSLTVRVPALVSSGLSAATVTLLSASDSDSGHACALMHACQTSRTAYLVYWCQQPQAQPLQEPKEGQWKPLPDFEVRAVYTLRNLSTVASSAVNDSAAAAATVGPATASQAPARVIKRLEACILTPRRPETTRLLTRSCDDGNVTILAQELWASIRPSCKGIAC